ncbi:uncharacterized protein PRD47_006529 [Ara ararauna]
MLNWTFLLSGMRGCYLSRDKKELRAMNIWLLLSALVYLQRCLSTSTREQGSSKTHIFYTVEIDGYSNTASFLAKQHGMQFISKVKWVNVRQLIIETSMLHSQSRMIEQVMIYLVQKENEIPGEAYNVIDSEEGLRDPLVFNDPYWPPQKKLDLINMKLPLP